MGKKLTIDVFREMARERGGECLSTEYRGVRESLRFRCSEGHEFETTGEVVRNGSWCVKCCGRGPVPLDAYKEIAEKKGGRLLSQTLDRASDPLRLVCSEGHEFELTGTSLRKGSWCPTCKHDRRLGELRDAAAARGGRLLSDRYLGSHKKHIFECHAGHVFSGVAHHVKNSGMWCSECYHASRRKG